MPNLRQHRVLGQPGADAISDGVHLSGLEHNHRVRPPTRDRADAAALEGLDQLSEDVGKVRWGEGKKKRK